MVYDQGTKYMKVKKLRELLSTLPDDLEVECNRVGNLSLYKGPGNWVGFIDFNQEEVILGDDDAG